MAASLHRIYEEAVAIMYGMNADDAGPDDDMELANSLKRLLEEHPNLLIYNHRREQTNRQSRRARRTSSRNRSAARKWEAPLMGVAISLRNSIAVQELIDAGYKLGWKLQFIKGRKMTAYEFVRRNIQENPVGDNSSMGAINTIERMLRP
jgi:hypothetical protein